LSTFENLGEKAFVIFFLLNESIFSKKYPDKFFADTLKGIVISPPIYWNFSKDKLVFHSAEKLSFLLGIRHSTGGQCFW
jgi:hypothetical protein